MQPILAENRLEEFGRYASCALRRALIDAPTARADDKPTVFTFQAAVLFIDISGYTALTAGAVRAGPVAIERFNYRLTNFFSRIVDIVYAHGGDVIEFAGDAVLAMFGADGNDLAHNVQTSARCALAARDERLDTSSLEFAKETIGVPTRITLGCGAIWMAILGRPARRRHVLLAGQAMEELAALHGTAPPKTIVLTDKCAALLKPFAQVTPLRKGGFVLDRLSQLRERPGAIQGKPANEQHLERVVPFLPVALAQRIQAGQGAWLAEMRFVCPVFVSLRSATAAEPLAIDLVSAAVLRLEDEFLRFGGELFQVRGDDHGIVAVGLFGTPGCMHEDDALRAARAAQAADSALARLGIESAIGVSSGIGLCGVYGNDKRCDYNIIGDVMNVAARLMARRGGVLCDHATAQRAGPRLQCRSLGAFALKGISKPTEVVRLDAASESSALSGRAFAERTKIVPVGRVEERRSIDEYIANFASGSPDARQGRILSIRGEAGMGKSTLIDYLMRSAATVGLEPISVAATAVDNLTPYFVWRAVLQQLFATEGASNQRAQMTDNILKALSSAPQLRAFVPLLGDIVTLDIADNDITRQMEPAARSSTTVQLLLELLNSTSASHILVFDDAHWIDSASWTVIMQIPRGAAKIGLVLALRMEVALPAEAAKFIADSTPKTIQLGGLTEAETADLMAKRLGADSTAPDVARFVCDRSAGNPFFAEELALVLHERGDLSIEAGTCIAREGLGTFAQFEVPVTVSATILERLDRLTAAQQLLVKVASVIGIAMPVEMLAAMLPVRGGRHAMLTDLQDIEARSLMVIESSGDRSHVRFRHAITQEAAYGMLPPSQRRSLHWAVGEWYERESAHDLDAVVALLAHHFHRTDDRLRAVKYLWRAGEQALQAHANGEAAHFLAASLDIDGDGKPFERAQRRRSLAEAHLKLSNLTTSREQAEQALRGIDEPLPKGRVSMALHLLIDWALHSFSTPMHVRVVPNAALAAQLHQLRAEIAFFEHNALALLHATFACLRHAQIGGPSRELATAHGTAAIVLGLVGLNRAANKHLQAANQAAARIGHTSTAAYIQQLASVCHSAVGNWDAAAQCIDRAAQAYLQVGELYRWQSTRMILAYQALHRGKFPEVARYLVEADERIVFPSGPLQVRVWFRTVELAAQNAAAVLGGDVPAPALMRDVELLCALADPSQALLCHGFCADALRLHGDWYAAQRHAELGLAVLHAHRPTTYYSLFGIASIVGTFLALGERDPSKWSTFRHSAKTALQRMRIFAFMVPIAAPSVHLLSARLHWLDGRRSRSRRLLGSALQQARRFGMNGVATAASRALEQRDGTFDGNQRQTGWA